jgi:hypothetical protein
MKDTLAIIAIALATIGLGCAFGWAIFWVVFMIH